MDEVFYIEAMNLPRSPIEVRQGGQELILGECMAALHPYSTWFPFARYGKTLADYYARHHPTSWIPDLSTPPRLDALYFGTPTIVDDQALFPADEPWTKASEREVVRILTAKAQEYGYRRIVSGLGTGDISVEERIEDMGGGEVVAMKKFGQFTDWVLVRDL